MLIYTIISLLIVAGLQGTEYALKKYKQVDLTEKDWWKYVKSSVFTILIMTYTFFMEGSLRLVRNTLVIGAYWLLQTILTIKPENLSWVPIKLDMSNMSLVKDSVFGIYMIVLLLLSFTLLGSIIG